MHMLKIFTPGPVSMGYQQLPHEDVCDASTEPKTSSSSVSLAAFAHHTHSLSINPSQGLTCQTPVGNRAIEPETEPLWPNNYITKAWTKAHGQTGKKTKADSKQATKDLHDALIFTENPEDLTNDDILGLIEKGANINAKTKYYGKETALHLAALRDSKRIIELLVNKGADVNAKTSYGWTVMQCAHKNGSITPLIRCMVNAGLKIDARCDNCGSTMLAHAAREHSWELVEFLLGKGARVNAEINIRGTALHLAVREGRQDVIKMLMLKRKANPGLPSIRGRSAIHYAVMDRGFADLPTSENLAHRQSILVELIESKKVDINARDERGITALHIAASGGYIVMIPELLKRGADFNLLDKDNMTAYDYCNRQKACLLMAEHNADVRGVDLRKAEAADQKHTASGFVHKVKAFFKSERNR
ncbi:MULTISPECIES: ankyrin repeat domain-containing protein [unclassified Endozoicomonas]|uniref:ankyrin repeat domain-containing protein n=1 Tax=unclassified Endozoicomonas TaxID=2644528 RepID=UPI003BB7E55D